MCVFLLVGPFAVFGVRLSGVAVRCLGFKGRFVCFRVRFWGFVGQFCCVKMLSLWC